MFKLCVYIFQPHMYTATMMRSDIVDPAAYSKDSQ